jgi:hypothetical protein
MDADLSSFSIDAFCERNDLSRSSFYKMKREGAAPRLMTVRGMTRISIEAERDWRRQCEEAVRSTKEIAS